MEFSADIKFSCNLIKNKTTTITYSGYLYKNNSEAVTMVYGFGDDWKKTTEQQMEKTDKGFVTRINLLNFDKLNFCFRNSNYVWDNNNNQNYGCSIANETPVSTGYTKESEFDDAFIINENVIGGILTNLFENNISNLQNIKPQTTTPISGTQTIKTKLETNIQDIKIENEKNTIQNIEIQDEKTLDDDIEIEDISIEGEVAEGIKIENIFDTMFIEPITASTLNSYNSTTQEAISIVEDVKVEPQATTEIDKLIASFKTPAEEVAETVQDTTYKSPVEVAEKDIENITPTDESNVDTYEALLKSIKEDYANRYGTPEETIIENIEVAPEVDEKTIEIVTDNIEATPVVDEKIEEIRTEPIETVVDNIASTSILEDIIEETNEVNNDESFYVDVEKTEAVNIEDTIVNTTEENKLNRQIEKSFDDIYLGEDYNSDLITDTLSNSTLKKEVTKFDMNGLIDEILSPVIKSSNFAENFNRITVEEPKETVSSYENVSNAEVVEQEDSIETLEELQTNPEASLIEEALNETNNAETTQPTVNEIETKAEQTTALAPVKEDSYMVSPRSLGTFYMIRKKIKLAFYKIFGILPKLLFDYDEEN